MDRFRYRALRLDGTEVAGEIDAADRADAVSRLAGRGVYASEVRRAGGVRRWRLLPDRTIEPREVTSFLAELALVLKSGMTVVGALDLVGSDMSGPVRALARALRDDLLAGQSMVDAMARHPHAFPPEVVALTRVSEATGRLDAALEALVARRRRSQALAERVTGALTYPAFLFFGALSVLVLFLVSVIPEFSAVVRDAGPTVDLGAAGFVFEASDLFNAHRDLLAAAGLAALVLAFAVGRSRAARTALADRLAGLPVIRDLARLRRTALFCGNLGVMLAHGLTLVEALRVLEGMFAGRVAAMIRSAADGVRRGGRLSEALSDRRLLPEIAGRMLMIGEETGELATLAAEAGALFEAKLERRLDAIVAVVGPLSIAIIAVLIAGLMASILTALVSVNQLAM